MISKFAPGLVVPIPTLPLAKTVNKAAPVEEATVNSGIVGAVEVPWMTKVEPGVTEAMPSWLEK